MLLDKIDLRIINSLAANCRTPYRNIASNVGITPNAVKTRVNKLLSNGIIQKFITIVNPIIFGYEMVGFLRLGDFGKAIKEVSGG